MALGVSHRLQDGIDAVETMTRFALAVLALASGVYTYLGVRSILDGSATAVFFAALIYSSAVSVAIYAFWTYMARFYPHVTGAAGRGAMLGVMALGCAMIIAMSSWLNAAALAGSAALEQHLAETLEDYTGDLDRAHQNALAAQSLLPDIQRTSERFARLAEQERETGALTGTTGSGSVVQLLSQMAAQLTELETGISASRERVTTLFDRGREHLAKMRELVSAPGAIDPRADQFSAEVVALSGVIASLEQTSIAASVKRAADDLSLGFIAPVASGQEADLANRQDRVMETIRASVAAQSKVLSQAADEILRREPVVERRFVPLSSAEAVLRYAGDFIPSWAGAISIDLLPAVLVFMLSIVHGAIRRQQRRLPFAERITAAELLEAMAVQKELSRRPAPEEMEEVLRDMEQEQSNITNLEVGAKPERAADVMPGGFDVVKDRLLRANDGELMRAAFYSLLAAAVVFLAIDVSEIREQARTTQAATPGQAEDLPALPPALTEGEPQDMPGELQTDMDALRTPIRFELQPGGILSAAGTIDLGAADRFRGELDQRGEYVKTVLLNSPGGSVDDALSISEEIRKRNLGTRVAAGSICASSCPIVFAGGVTREAASDAIIGVHQVFNGGKDAPTPEQAMATAQATTARVSRHLEAMGIAPGLWFRALETPPDRLYYLSDEERRELRLTTGTLSAEAG